MTSTERLKELAGGDKRALEELARTLHRRGDAKGLRTLAREQLNLDGVDWRLEVRRFGVWGAVDLLGEPIESRDKRQGESLGGPAPAYHLNIDPDCSRRLSGPFLVPLVWNDDKARTFAGRCAQTAMRRAHALIATCSHEASTPVIRSGVLMGLSGRLLKVERALATLTDLGPFLASAERLLREADDEIQSQLRDIDALELRDSRGAPTLTRLQRARECARWSAASASACFHDRGSHSHRAIIAARKAEQYARRAHHDPEVGEASHRAIMLRLLLEEG